MRLTDLCTSLLGTILITGLASPSLSNTLGTPVPDFLVSNPRAANHSGFGHAVVVDGSQLLVGAYGMDGAVFLLDGPTLDVEQSYFKPTAGQWAGFDAAIALSEDYVLVGGPFAGNIAWLFDRSNGTYLRPLMGQLFSQFGWSTAIHGDRLLIAAPDQHAIGATGAVSPGRRLSSIQVGGRRFG